MVRQLAWIKSSVHFMNSSLIFVPLLLTSQLCGGQDFAINNQNATLPDSFQLDVMIESNAEFLHDEWLPGTLFYPNGTTRDYEKIKFDRHINRLQIQVEAGELDVYANLLSGFLIKESETSGHMFLVLDFKGEPSYFELLSNGPFQLLSHSILREETADITSPSTDELIFEKEEEIIEVEEKLFVRIDGRIKILKPNRKSVIKLTGQDKTTVVTYIQENNLNLQLKTDLARLFNYLNSQ